MHDISKRGGASYRRPAARVKRRISTPGAARRPRDLENARWLADEVRAAPGWRVLNHVTLQTLCVRHEPPGLAGDALDAHTRGWADRVNRAGDAYLTPALLDGRWMVRVSVDSLATERVHVARLWAVMQRAAADG